MQKYILVLAASAMMACQNSQNSSGGDSAATKMEQGADEMKEGMEMKADTAGAYLKEQKDKASAAIREKMDSLDARIEELKKDGVAANTLWPATTIATAAVRNLLGGEALVNMSRTPEIVADAAFHILKRAPASCTGQHFIDEEVLRMEGITDFAPYAVTPGGRLQPDLFL